MAFDIITPKKMAVGNILTVVGVFYTVPSLTRSLIKNIDICNNNVFPVKISLYLVPDSDSPADTNKLLSEIIIKGESFLQWAGIQVLNEGDTIQILADKTGASVHISGGEAI